jgi:hypothetical protein
MCCQVRSTTSSSSSPCSFQEGEEIQDGETQEGEGRGESGLDDNMSPGGMLLSGGSRRPGHSVTPEKEVKPPTFTEAAQNKA